MEIKKEGGKGNMDMMDDILWSCVAYAGRRPGWRIAEGGRVWAGRDEKFGDRKGKGREEGCVG